MLRTLVTGYSSCGRVLRPALLGGVIVGALVAIASLWARTPDSPPLLPSSALGSVVPNIRLQLLDGTQVLLRDQLGGYATIVAITSIAECASCANLRLEFQILRRQSAQFKLLVIGSGARRDEFISYLTAAGVDSRALVDEEGALLRTLGVAADAAVLVIDSAGKVLFVDDRSATRRAHYPTSRLLYELMSLAEFSSD